MRQDEFTIWLGRRKCQRHVFLFEDLILFSKPKRIEGGFDVYIYKRSFKVRAALQLPLVQEVSMAGFPRGSERGSGRTFSRNFPEGNRLHLLVPLCCEMWGRGLLRDRQGGGADSE